MACCGRGGCDGGAQVGIALDEAPVESVPDSGAFPILPSWLTPTPPLASDTSNLFATQTRGGSDGIDFGAG